MTSDFASQLFQLLSVAVNPKDGEQARTVTSTLNKQFYTDPQCVPALVQIASEATEVSIRQLAAIEARKRIDRHWDLIPPEIKSSVRKALIQRVAAEPEVAVSHALAFVIAAVAERDWLAGRWPELMPTIMDATQSATATHREVAVYVLLALVEVLVAENSKHLPELLKVLATTLSDPESALVRNTSLEALGSAADFVDTEDKASIKIFQELVPNMMKVLGDAIAANDERAASRGFNVFDSMLSAEAPLLNVHFTPFVEFLVATFSNAQLGEEVRVMAGNLIVLLPLYRRSRLTKLKLIEPILSHCLPVAVEHDGDEDDDEDSPGRSAMRIVNAFATNLPAQHVFPLVSAKVVEFANDAQRPSARRAAMMCIALIVDGCADAMRPHAEDLVHLVLRLMQDGDSAVRRSACLALSSLAEALEMEVCAMHAQILPVLFQLMQDTSSMAVLRNATNALDAVLEGLGDDIHAYIQGLMETLMRLLAVPDTKVRQVVVAAIGSTAHAAGEQFQQYFPHVYPTIVEIMSIKNDDADEMLMRGIATDSMSAMAEAVGADMFRPHLQQTASLAADSMHIDSPKLKECAFCFFGVLSRSFKAEFTPFLSTLVPILFESIRARETFVDDGEHDLSISTGVASNAGSAVDSMGDDDDDDDDDDDAFEVHNAISDEKATAMDVLGDLFENTEAEFLPFLDETMKLLLENTTHYSDSVRKAIVIALFKILATMHKMSNAQPWIAGLPVQVAVHENVARMVQVVMDSSLKMFEEEDDRMVGAEMCDSLASALRMVGPIMVSHPQHLEVLCNLLVAVFTGKHLAQQDQEGEEMDEDEVAELDGVFLSAAGDVVGALAKVLGASSFGPVAQRLLPHISKYCKPNSQTSERSMAVGTLAEAVAGMAEGVTAWHQPLLQLFTRAMQDPETEVRSNAAYGLGVLCESTGTPYDAASILRMLVPCMARDSPAATSLPQSADNACGAVARILLRADAWRANRDSLAAFVRALPMQADYEENKPVMDLVARALRLAMGNDADAVSAVVEQAEVLNGLLAAIVHVLMPAHADHITDEARVDLVQLLRELASSGLCSRVQTALGELPSEMQAAVQQAMA